MKNKEKGRGYYRAFNDLLTKYDLSISDHENSKNTGKTEFQHYKSMIDKIKSDKNRKAKKQGGSNSGSTKSKRKRV